MALALESSRLLTWRAAMLKDNKKPFTKVPVGKGSPEARPGALVCPGRSLAGVLLRGPVGLLPQGGFPGRAPLKGPVLAAPPEVKSLTPLSPVLRKRQWPSWPHRRLRLRSPTR